MLVDSEKRHPRGALVGQVHNMARESSWGATDICLLTWAKKSSQIIRLVLFFSPTSGSNPARAIGSPCRPTVQTYVHGAADKRGFSGKCPFRPRKENDYENYHYS